MKAAAAEEIEHLSAELGTLQSKLSAASREEVEARWATFEAGGEDKQGE